MGGGDYHGFPWKPRKNKILEEGEDVRMAAKSAGWMMAVYILVGMMGLEILFFLLIMISKDF